MMKTKLVGKSPSPKATQKEQGGSGRLELLQEAGSTGWGATSKKAFALLDTRTESCWERWSQRDEENQILPLDI